MGMQFWWFYDIAVIAVMLIVIFIYGRSPFPKAIAALLSVVLGLALATATSSSLAESIYNDTIRRTNVNKLTRELDENPIIPKIKYHIESLGYNVNISEDSLEEIYLNEKYTNDAEKLSKALYTYVNNINGRTVDKKEDFDKKMASGYAKIINEIVSKGINSYAVDEITEKIYQDPESVYEFIRISKNADVSYAAKFIEKNYISSTYKDIVKLICFIVLMILIVVAVQLFAYIFLDKKEKHVHMSITEHICGGIIGIVVGVAFIFTAAVMIRIYTMLGKGEMLFFNEEVIEQSKLFKYIYKFAVKL